MSFCCRKSSFRSMGKFDAELHFNAKTLPIQPFLYTLLQSEQSTNWRPYICYRCAILRHCCWTIHLRACTSGDTPLYSPAFDSQRNGSADYCAIRYRLSKAICFSKSSKQVTDLIESNKRSGSHSIFIRPICRLDWGIEGVLQKLMSLWNSDMYPIGMEELMQSNNQRISAATAFFSLMGKRIKRKTFFFGNIHHRVSLIRFVNCIDRAKFGSGRTDCDNKVSRFQCHLSHCQVAETRWVARSVVTEVATDGSILKCMRVHCKDFPNFVSVVNCDHHNDNFWILSTMCRRICLPVQFWIILWICLLFIRRK